MAKYDDTLKRRLLGHLAVALMQLVARIPRPVSLWLGRLLGSLLWYLPTRSKRITLTNVSLCFPDLPPQAQRQLAHSSLQEMAINAFNSIRLWIKPKETLKLISRVSGSHLITDSLTRGQPVMVLAPHLGCWELLNYWLSSNYQLHALFKPSHLKPVNDLVQQQREYFDSTMYPATAKGVVSLVRTMRHQAVVTGVLPDQVPAPKAGIFSPFFGVPAYTATLAAKLASQTGSVAVLGYAERLPDNSYHIRISPVPDAFYNEDLQTSVDTLNHVVAQGVRQAPEQYLWNYKRFRRSDGNWQNPYH